MLLPSELKQCSYAHTAYVCDRIIVMTDCGTMFQEGGTLPAYIEMDNRIRTTKNLTSGVKRRRNKQNSSIPSP
jgi:hypothetical protein